MQTIRKWGLKFTLASKSDMISHIRRHLVENDKKLCITGVNVEIVSLLDRSKLLHDAILDSDIVNIDGAGVVLALKIAGIKEASRVSCPDLFMDLLDLASDEGYSVFFLGGEHFVLDNMIQRLRDQFPKLNIVGYNDGFWKNEGDVLQAINSCKPTFLFLGLPSPMKEEFIKNNKDQLFPRLYFGVGGAFDILGGKVRRAPKLMRKCNLEWLYRVSIGPGNYGKRFLKSLFPFVRYIIRNRNLCCLVLPQLF